MYEVEIQTKKSSFEVFVGALGAIGSFIFGSIEAIIMALALCVVLYLFLLTPHEVVGSSMYPNFHDGEYLLANKVIYKVSEPQRGDVIIFMHSDSIDYIKRIIGLPGETVTLRDGKVYINDKALDESGYLDSTVYTGGESFLKEGVTYTVPAGKYFAMGDNRMHSSDSRDFGPIEKGVIKGKAWVVYFPFSQFRFVPGQAYKQK
jgi:signal peptidase I